MPKLALRVAFIGKGKVGVALARAAKHAGAKSVVLRAARDGLPRHPFPADLLVLCVRDRELAPLAELIAETRAIEPDAVCVHVAGALDAEVLAPLRCVCRGVAQMHPMISFADKAKPPALAGGHVHVKGDALAEKRARQLAHAIGMTPRTFPSLDAIGYHAAAAFVANGSAVLAALGARILARAGVPEDVAPAMLGPLLRSVADNVGTLGFPTCLTGPVRRGDPGAIEKHARILAERVPEAVPLFIESAMAQVPLARALGEAQPEAFDAIQDVLLTARKRLSRGGLPQKRT